MKTTPTLTAVSSGATEHEDATDVATDGILELDPVADDTNGNEQPDPPEPPKPPRTRPALRVVK